MRFFAALTLFLLAVPAPEIRYFRFERAVTMPAQTGGQTCMVVDPQVFAHSSTGLADLRLYQGSTETPYALRTASGVVSGGLAIALLNPGKSGNETVFDAKMPDGAYSDVELGVTGKDFLATVTVSGSQTQDQRVRTRIGSFTIFDLTRQRLGRSTVLHLPESDFRYLHFEIAGPVAPESVTGLSLVRPASDKPRFVSVGEAAEPKLQDRNSVFEMVVPAHTPVDRIVFVPGRNPANFSRSVEIAVSLVSQRPASDASEPPRPVTSSGEILRVHSVQDGRRIDEERLAVDAPQVDFDSPAKWTVTIENHDDLPIQGTAIRLEMIERDLCFDASSGGTYSLYYGDPVLTAPVYDYAALFAAQKEPAKAQPGAETPNPAYQPRPDDRAFTEKHPVLLWIALVLVVGLLGLVAFRSFKNEPAKNSH